MVTSSISDHELVKMGMAELCKKAGFADCGNLVQRDLEFICDSIESKTGVLISLSTIKRLMNGQFSRQPQIATLNAIASFLGYQNWQDFKSQKSQALYSPGSPEAITGGLEEATAVFTKKRSYTRPILISTLFLLLSFALLAFLKLRKQPAGNFSKAQFTITKTTRNDLPNTVVFNYDIDEVIADSFFIQQSWDKNRRVKIEKGQYTITDIYYEPGYHVAKLIANEQVIKTIDVSIPTDRWFFYAKEKKPGSLPKYIQPTAPFKDGFLKMEKEDVLRSGVDMEKEQTYIQVYFPLAFESSSDNFILKARARVNSTNNHPCPFLMFEVFCQKNFMYFMSRPTGCASELNAQFGEKTLNGKTNDLSALGSDVKEWQDIEFIVKNKKVSIRINNREVYTGAYEQSSGLITGLGFISNGLCEVDYVKLESVEGKLVYENQF